MYYIKGKDCPKVKYTLTGRPIKKSKTVSGSSYLHFLFPRNINVDFFSVFYMHFTLVDS